VPFAAPAAAGTRVAYLLDTAYFGSAVITAADRLRRCNSLISCALMPLFMRGAPLGV
jgi:hypothetical protein